MTCPENKVFYSRYPSLEGTSDHVLVHIGKVDFGESCKKTMCRYLNFFMFCEYIFSVYLHQTLVYVAVQKRKSEQMLS